MLTFTASAIPQVQKPREKYILGEEQKLQIHVHIWGEVNKPGDFLVSDGTNVLELISLAGGPTQYANLSNVQVTRQAESLFISKEGLLDIVDEAEQHNISKEALEKSLKERFSHRIIKVNVKRYLEVADAADVLPTLKPGDVVRVKQNFWYKWRAIVRVASEIAIIASVYVWYVRAEQWN